MTAGDNNSPVFDFTSLDFTGIRADLERYAQSRFPTELWTDFNFTQFGVFLLELMAYASDNISYNYNAATLESIVATVIREENFRNLAKTFDYQMASASASTTTLRITGFVAGPPFTISEHFRWVADDGTVFQPVTDYTADPTTILGGTGYLDIDLVQGEEWFETFSSTGQPNQSFVLGQSPVIDGTLVLSVSGDVYTLATNFSTYASTDQVFILQTSELGITTILFGDGINGVIPAIGTNNISVTYKTGGGTEMNVAVGTITSFGGSSDPLTLVPVEISGGNLVYTNTVAATGGAAKETLLHAKAALPKAIAANDRAVSLEDFAALAVLVPGVYRAIAVRGKPQGGSNPVILVIVPSGGGDPSSALANSIAYYFRGKKLAGKKVFVKAPVYVDLEVEVDVFVRAASAKPSIATKITNIVADKYALDSMDFSPLLGLQDLYDTLEPTKVDGVSRVFIKTFSIKPYWGVHTNFTINGTGSVEAITVNKGTVRRREWLVRFSSGGNFTVYERRLGTVSRMTDSTISDDTASYEDDELTIGYNGDTNPNAWVLVPDPEFNSTGFTVSGNTATVITTAAGLIGVAEPDDDYVVQRLQVNTGFADKRTVASIVSPTRFNVGSTTGWTTGDQVLITHGADTFRTTIANVNSTDLYITAAPTAFAVAVSDTLEWVWQSDDASVEFVVRQGTTVFSAGDEFYVDTYARTGDLQVRRENFVLLDPADLTVNAIGGVR